MLTIGQVADVAGVTVRAVRHYHARGLLPEPVRDASGYRRYGPQAVVDLIRIKTLADAGVPLSRVGELLQAEPERFEQAVEEIDRDLVRRIDQLQQHRRRVSQLVTGDGLALPADVADYLTRLRDLGVSERFVGIERNGWIMLTAHSPEHVAGWIRLKLGALGDRQYQDLYLGLDRAFAWRPDDPRLKDLADAMAEYAGRELPDGSGGPKDAELEDSFADLLDAQFISASPAWEQLGRLIRLRRLNRR